MWFDHVTNLSLEQFNTIGIFLLCYGGYVALIKLTFSGKHVTDEDIENSRENEIMKRVFPVLSSALKPRYMCFKVSCQRFDVLFWLRIAVGTLFFFGRCNAIHGYYDGLYFRSFIIIGSIAWFFFLSWFLAMGMEFFLRKASTRESIHAALLLKWANHMHDIVATGICEEIAVVLAQIAFGFSLYGRVRAGPCPEGITWLESARCNPVAHSHSIPMDHVMYMIVFPVVTPLTVRNIRFEAGVLMWFTVLGFVKLSMDHVNAGADAWMIVSIMVVSLTFVFENERFLKHSFLSLELVKARDRTVLIAEEEKAKTQKRQMKLEADNEREMAKRERGHLVALIGNVAHDLKTPLHSFKMDIEFLRTTLVNIFIPAKLPMSPEDPTQLPDDVESLLGSLGGSTDFMVMAVNRGIEFAKAQSGIQLTPTVVSFCLKEVIALPLQIMESMKAKTKIELMPMPVEIYPYIFSDMHWLRENLLCFLSNAVKYSLDGTVVTIAVDLATAGDIAQALEGNDSDDRSRSSRSLSVDSRDSPSGEESGIGMTGLLTKLKKSVRSSLTSINSDKTSKTDNLDIHETILDSPQNVFLRFTVMDRGVGIPEDERKRLFKPFAQMQRLTGGTGLGLFSLSKRMEAIGGHRGVTSRPDDLSGSAFWFAIPYRPDTMAESHSTKPSTPTDEGSIGMSTSRLPSGSDKFDSYDRSSLPSSTFVSGFPSRAVSGPVSDNQTPMNALGNRELTLLIVDDSLSILKVTARSAAQLGHKCETATNGAIALERLEQALPRREIDMVLIDFQMPVMDGPTCVKRFREFEANFRRQQELQEQEVLERRLQEAFSRGTAQNQEATERDVFISPTVLEMANRDTNLSSRVVGRLPIIGMSANSNSETRTIGLEAGMDSFIGKPFSMKELKPLLEKVFLDSRY